MAYARTNIEDSFYNTANVYVPGASQFLCEEEADVQNLPKDPMKIQVGSRALVIETGNTYIFGPSKKWLLFKGITMID